MRTRRNVVGSSIRKIRQNEGITQEDLALRSGLSQGYINQLEHGKRNYTQKSLELIAEALSVPVKEFFQEEAGGLTSIIKERENPYRKKRGWKKELIDLLREMPEEIMDHYVTLLKLEKELLKARA
jgi:transcriptional regulator with XRE-family HTH domain